MATDAREVPISYRNSRPFAKVILWQVGGTQPLAIAPFGRLTIRRLGTRLAY